MRLPEEEIERIDRDAEAAVNAQIEAEIAADVKTTGLSRK
jgi:hypothetical protein